MANKLALDANRRLAIALGWTNIVDVGNALLGKPTWVCDNSRDQVPVPNWAGDWKDCGPLMCEHNLYPFTDRYNQGKILVGRVDASYSIAYLNDFIDSSAATRYAVVLAVCEKLESAR